ncbi:MAG TPA: DUF4292 domain-containing protein [Chitinophagaceae bacterium]|nr:DUF4292 domain-containing protein [Chitinophagaceae bacterium]
MRIVILIIVIAVLSSCRSTKKIQTAITKRDTIAVPARTNKVDTSELIKNALAKLSVNKQDYKTFTAKLDIDYRGGDAKHYDVNGTLRIYKDSTIWISVNAVLGIEAMRLLITKDSIFLLDKLNKTYSARSIDYLQEVTALPLTLLTLQDLLVGNPVFVDSNLVSYSTSNKTTTILSIGPSFKNLLTIDNEDNTLLHSKLDDVNIAKSRTADLGYDDFEKKQGKSFPTKRRITVAEKTKLEVSLKFKQVDFNEEVSFPFSVPKNYKSK